MTFPLCNLNAKILTKVMSPVLFLKDMIHRRLILEKGIVCQKDDISVCLSH